MWKSGFLLRGARLFYPQPSVDKRKSFHRACEEFFSEGYPQKMFPHSTIPVDKFLTKENVLLSYRQELILEVMSRMLFCMV